MEETVPEPKKRGWPKGKPRKAAVAAAAPVAAPESEAPIYVKILLKNGVWTSFGCAEHTVENGFHVFMYPSERDRYRTTRREFAISEIIEIEITEARRQAYEFTVERPSVVTEPVAAPRGPKIHSVRQHAAGVLAALEQSNGPIKMDTPPGISFGGHDG